MGIALNDRPVFLFADPELRQRRHIGNELSSYAGVVAFMTVVAEGNFSKAGDRLGIGRSAVSRGVQKLESQLGARLLSRTTRSLALTPEGEIFHARCQPGVAHISQAIEDLRDLRDGPPRGSLRISASVGFGRRVVAPLLWGFQALYPDIELDLLLSDAQADFISDRIDISFRNGRMEDSQIIARQIVPMQMLLCASPDYAKSRGMPQSLEDLAQHECINFRQASGRLYEWEFKVQGELRKTTPARSADSCARGGSFAACLNTHPTIAATSSAI